MSWLYDRYDIMIWSWPESVPEAWDELEEEFSSLVKNLRTMKVDPSEEEPLGEQAMAKLAQTMPNEAKRAQTMDGTGPVKRPASGMFMPKFDRRG